MAAGSLYLTEVTQIGTLRFSIITSGSLISAFTFEDNTQSQLVNWIVTKHGRFLYCRLLWSGCLFFTLFFIVVVLSYYLLPQELLKNKHPLQNWDTSQNVFICTMQIFWFNSISAIVMVIANLFSQKKGHHKNYVAIGYIAFFALICFNAVVLGTWSFSVESTPVPLWGRNNNALHSQGSPFESRIVGAVINLEKALACIVVGIVIEIAVNRKRLNQ